MFCGKPGTFWPLCGFLPPVQYIRTADGLSTKKCGEIFAKSVDRRGRMWYYFSCAERAPLNARVVELVDSLASGASARKGVRVRLPPRAPRRSKLHIACSDFFKSQSALIALLLLSKSNPLRWASIWFWAQSRKKIDFTHLLHQKTPESLRFRGFSCLCLAVVPLFSRYSPDFPAPS